MDYDSDSSNNISYYVDEYNKSNNKWIECNDVTTEDFDIISSRLSHATDKLSHQNNNWKIISRNVIRSYKSFLKLVKRGKDKAVYKRIFQKHRKRNDFFIYEMREPHKIQMVLTENEWFKREYDRQVGEPKPQKEEVLLKRATRGLKLQSLWIPFDLICYRHPVKHESTLQQVDWRDTPLAITCCCPAGICTCLNRKNRILPPAKIPSKSRAMNAIKSFCWSIHLMKYPKSAGTLVPKLVETVEKEAKYYRSPQGRSALIEMGPEFCMSGCIQYLVSSVEIDLATAAEIGKLQPTTVGELSFIKGEPADYDKDELLDIAADVCDEFHCTVATQTENDPNTDELIVGEYSSVLYANIQESYMNDVEGMKLQISSYSHEQRDPCELTINRILHVQEIKEHMSKMKELYSTFSAAKGSYCCKDVSCQMKGLSFIESIGGMLGKCECSEDSNNDNIEEAMPEEPEYIPPPLFQKVIDVKKEIKDFINKYFTPKVAPHPCSQKARMDAIKKRIIQKNTLNGKANVVGVVKNGDDIELNNMYISNKNKPKYAECEFSVDNYSKNIIGSKSEEIRSNINRTSIDKITQDMKLNVLNTLPLSEDKSIYVIDGNNEHKTTCKVVSDIYNRSNAESGVSKNTSVINKSTLSKDPSIDPSISNILKPASCNTQIGDNSQEFGTSGVFAMISKKVSRSGWKGWFSFSSGGDKSIDESKVSNPDNNIRLLKKLKNKESAIQEYNRIVKNSDQHQSDDSIEEVVQNVESLRNLRSSHSEVNRNNKSGVNSQKSDPVMPKHYRFYF